MMTTDLPGRLLDAVTRPLPHSRENWGRAMRAEMAALDARGERWRFAAGCLRVAVTQLHLLRAALHLAVVLGALGTVFAYGPDAVIPAITPDALPADRVADSRIEIVDPYVLVLVLGGLAATALAVATVSTRRPTTTPRTPATPATLRRQAGA
jgi:hypothetical protein